MFDPPSTLIVQSISAAVHAMACLGILGAIGVLCIMCGA